MSARRRRRSDASISGEEIVHKMEKSGTKSDKTRPEETRRDENGEENRKKGKEDDSLNIYILSKRFPRHP